MIGFTVEQPLMAAFAIKSAPILLFEKGQRDMEILLNYLNGEEIFGQLERLDEQCFPNLPVIELQLSSKQQSTDNEERLRELIEELAETGRSFRTKHYDKENLTDSILWTSKLTDLNHSLPGMIAPMEIDWNAPIE
jgi:hypothetical protein